jgi:hypothetical protein
VIQVFNLGPLIFPIFINDIYAPVYNPNRLWPQDPP